MLALQLAAAGLLWLTLFPPQRPLSADTLVIASASASAAELAAIPAATRLRLPEAPTLANASPVPDLATALRQHPGTRELVVVGHGLPARDRSVALPPLRFRPAAAPHGLAQLHAPPLLAPGARFDVTTRVQGLAQARVELLDPAGQRVALATPDRAGHVRLSASARDSGEVVFTLRALDAEGNVFDQLPVPVRVRAVPAPALRLLAGAPGPELKYLQRWATDTGARLQTGINLGGGERGGGNVALGPALIEGRLRRHRPVEQFGRPRHLHFRQRQRRLGRGNGGRRLDDALFGPGHGRLGRRPLGQEIGAVEHRHDVVAANEIALAEAHLRHAAGELGGNVEMFDLNAAVGLVEPRRQSRRGER